MRTATVGVLFAAWVTAGVNEGGRLQAIHAADASRRNDASGLVSDALRQEIDGDNAHRGALLREAHERAPQLASAYWHTGYVKHGSQWLRYDEIPKLAAQSQRLAAYRAARQSYPDTIDGQLALAGWCARCNLPTQQRVHLTRVLELSPDHISARTQLGYRRINGMWLTSFELEEQVNRATRRDRAMRKWIPKLLADRSAIVGRSARRRKRAEERLLAINASDATEAIERVFSSYNEETALLGVRMLSNNTGREATAGLARQAVYSPSESVRNAAIQELRSRSFDSFVPGLLSVMVSPTQTRRELYQDMSGRTLYRHVFYREGQETAQMAVFETDYGPSLGHLDPVSRREIARIRQIKAANLARAREDFVVRQNAIDQSFNERVCAVLTGATEQALPAEPDRWWQWWNQHNEVFVEGQKPVDAKLVQSKNDVQFTAARIVRIDRNRPSPPPPRKRHDCLAAGTAVWTESGPRRIERIRAGDLVLSKDVDTGELSYKPVLRTTIRPREDLIRVEAADQPIDCTGGHPFWVSGIGWVKARDLKPGVHLHSVGGTTLTRSIGEAAAEPTYNLVVGDFHTYFVGETLILTHDNTVRRPTDAIVPGLAIK